jgi:hypothetical protein
MDSTCQWGKVSGTLKTNILNDERKTLKTTMKNLHETQI